MKKCLRCRKDAVEGCSFCAQCLKTVALPVQESPYLNTQINLNAKKTRPVMKTAVPNSASKIEEKQRSNKGWITAVIILSLLCLTFAFGCAWFSRDLWLEYLR